LDPVGSEAQWDAGAGWRPEVERLRSVVHRLVRALRPEEIWLFGSRAEGRAREGSDFDLLTVLPDDATEEQLDPIAAWQHVRGLGVPVDVIPCTRSEFEDEKAEIDTLPRAAYERGLCIFMSSEKRIAAYLDLVEQDLQAAEILARAKNRYAAYHCQQAIEKLIKALLLSAGKEAGIEHHLDVLIDRLGEDHALSNALRPLDKYTPFATTFRYPTPGGRIPAAPSPDTVTSDIGIVRDLLARVKDIAG
jgi:HEPN domain-containing protein/predicted nucleotidyltransferase